jgi:Ca2+:H+ antiporter
VYWRRTKNTPGETVARLVADLRAVLVFASYLFGRPMNLEFTIPEIVAVLVSVVIVAQISGDGESNWLEGLLLLSLYAILGILFFFLPAAA